MSNVFVGPSDAFISGQSIAFKMLMNYEFKHKIAGGKSISLHNSVGGSSLYKFFYLFVFLIKLFLVVCFERPSVFYLSISRSHAGFLKDLPVFLCAMITGSKLCVHLHGSDFKDFYNSTSGVTRVLVDFCYRRVSVAFVLSEGMKAEFEDFPQITIVTVFNCAPDLSMLARSTSVTEHMNILYMSNIIRSKGILELIEAVKALHLEGENVSLRIAGDFVGDEFMTAEKIRKEFYELLSGAEFITYEGIVRGQEKNDLFEWSSIVALPTYYKTEAQPIVLIEAMSCGRFILSSSFKYIPEYITDKENGTLVESVSINSLLHAMRNIIADDVHYEQVCENNRNYYKKNFTESVHCERILNCIRDLS
jgi:glycosyltransferase involved in cell wall biosynthesis